MTQHFNITPPPSTNKLFRNAVARDNVRHRIKTKAYDGWLKTVMWEIKLQRKGAPTLEGPTVITMSRRRHHPSADISNSIKPVEDALQKAGVIENDRQVTCVTAAWADHDGCRVTVGPDVG